MAAGLKIRKAGRKHGPDAAVAAEPVVFSGFRDPALEDLAIMAGYKVATAVSSKTAIVVAKDPAKSSGKLSRARELGVVVLSARAFEDRARARAKKRRHN